MTRNIIYIYIKFNDTYLKIVYWKTLIFIYTVYCNEIYKMIYVHSPSKQIFRDKQTRSQLGTKLCDYDDVEDVVYSSYLSII